MPRILLVKTSSLGDVVHNLPVVADIASRWPEAQIDWAVEESFAALPTLHPKVGHAIPVAIRRWRRALFNREVRREIGAFLEALRAVRYDAVIDTQGLLKSALIAFAAEGRRYGFDFRSSREPLAIFYDRTFRVPRSLHAVERSRILTAAALGYTVPPVIDYGIQAGSSRVSGDYAVLVHATSAAKKVWDEERWIAIGGALAGKGLKIVLPWGSDAERVRSERLAAAIPGASSPSRLPLVELAALLARARCVVGVDTGLTHLSAALGVATVGIYTATNPSMTGLYGCARAVNLGALGANPGIEDVLLALGDLGA
jgi:heptosyltransferase-1